MEVAIGAAVDTCVVPVPVPVAVAVAVAAGCVARGFTVLTGWLDTGSKTGAAGVGEAEAICPGSTGVDATAIGVLMELAEGESASLCPGQIV